MTKPFVPGNVWLPNDVFRQRQLSNWPIPDAWTPEIAGASLHLDADATATLTLSAGRVTNWISLINSYNFVQSEALLSPLFIDNALESKGVVDFENSSQFLECLDVDSIAIETLVALVRPRALTYTSTNALPATGALENWQILSFTADPRDANRGVNLTKLWGLGIFSGQVAELIGFREVISQSDIECAEAYLAYNWDSTDLLPANHPYKNASPIGFRY